MSHDKLCEAMLMPPDMNRAQLCHCRLREVAAERDAVRADARKWMDRYSSLFLRVSCAVAPDTTERGIYLAWQREVDDAYARDAAPQEPQP